MDGETMLDLRGSAKFLGIGEAYMRTLIRKGVIPTALQPIAKDSQVRKHMLKVSDLEAFRDREQHRTGARADGRNRYLIHLNSEELEGLQEFLTINYPEVEVRRAVKPKYGTAEPEDEIDEE